MAAARLFSPIDYNQMNIQGKNCFNICLNRYNPITKRYDNLADIEEKFHKLFSDEVKDANFKLELNHHMGGICYATVTKGISGIFDENELIQLLKFFNQYIPIPTVVAADKSTLVSPLTPRDKAEGMVNFGLKNQSGEIPFWKVKSEIREKESKSILRANCVMR